MIARLLLASSLLLATGAVCAQDAPPPPPAAPSAQGAPHTRQQKMRGDARGPREDMRGGGEMHGDMHGAGGGPLGHLLPMGAWWRNTELTKSIGLTADQQKRIDDLFLQSRLKLVDMHAALEKQELTLEPLVNANPVDQPRAMAAIAKIADTRAELEKANANMLLSIRAVLTAEQWTKLQAAHGGKHGPGGPRGPGGPGNPMHHERGDKRAPQTPPQP